MRDYIKKAFFVFAFILVSVSLVRSFFVYKDRFKVYQKLKDRKDKLKKENIQLQTEQRQIESSRYIEKVARQQLQFTKQGEVVVIIPSPTPEIKKTEKLSIPVWQRWVSLLVE